MSDHSSETLQRAAEAAEQLIGFYPSIMASDAKVYAAGMVKVLAHYPEHLVSEAIDPYSGLPSLHDYPPTMKQIKEFLEPRYRNLCRMQEMKDRFERAKLPSPPRDLEADAKIRDGFKKLKAVLQSSDTEALAGISGRKQ
jgi:hypothetical protein